MLPAFTPPFHLQEARESMIQSFCLVSLIGILGLSCLLWGLQELASARRQATEQTQLDAYSWSICHQTRQTLDDAVRKGNEGLQKVQQLMTATATACLGAMLLTPKALAICRIFFESTTKLARALEVAQTEALLIAWPLSLKELQWRLQSKNQLKSLALVTDIQHELHSSWDQGTGTRVPRAYKRSLPPVHQSAQDGIRLLLMNPQIRWPYHLEEKEAGRVLFKLRSRYSGERFNPLNKKTFSAKNQNSGCEVLREEESFRVKRL